MTYRAQIQRAKVESLLLSGQHAVAILANTDGTNAAIVPLPEKGVVNSTPFVGGEWEYAGVVAIADGKPSVVLESEMTTEQVTRGVALYLSHIVASVTPENPIACRDIEELRRMWNLPDPRGGYAA